MLFFFFVFFCFLFFFFFLGGGGGVPFFLFFMFEHSLISIKRRLLMFKFLRNFCERFFFFQNNDTIICSRYLDILSR